MPKLPEKRHRTADHVLAQVAADAEDWRRVHLGASVIGKECHRELWYGFRWATDPKHDGRMIRLFGRGHDEEIKTVAAMRAAGLTVHDVDGDNNQYRFEDYGGHFGGSIDGAVLGLLEAPKTWHLFECKTSNAKRFAVLQKQGVAKSNPQHFAQMQVYMSAMELTRAFYWCVCKDTDEIYTERIRADEGYAQATRSKAERVVFSSNPLTRLSEDPSWWECKFCEHRPHCHLSRPETIERNCRTCIDATPQPDGTWTCDLLNMVRDVDEQRAGCANHRVIPEMVGWDVVEAGAGRVLKYLDGNGEERRDTGVAFARDPG